MGEAIHRERDGERRRVETMIRPGLRRRITVRTVKSALPRFGLRDSDVILASFPKTGSTWVRFVLANIVSLEELGGREVDYELLNGPLAAEYDPHAYPSIEYRVIPRFVKTHMEYDRRRFGRQRVLYVERNPGDTMVSSYEYYRARRGPERFEGAFKSFIRDPRYGIRAWARHMTGWRPAARAVVSYEMLKADGAAHLTRAFAQLEITNIAAPTIAEAVRRSDFKVIRKMEEERGLDARARDHLRDGFRFARRGKVGEWTDYFDDADHEYMMNILRAAGLREVPLPTATIRAGPDAS